MKNLQYVKPILIINVACLILTILLVYKHYFNNDGKGIDEYVLALSIYSLNSFFAIMSKLRSDNNKKKLFWLILGLLYVGCSTLFLERQILYGQGVSKLIMITSSIPLSLFGALLLFVKRVKIFEPLVNTLLLFSAITSILPILTLVFSIFGLIWSAF